MHGILTPCLSVPLRVTMSWKHTPQASTLMITSLDPGAGSGTVSMVRTSTPPGWRTTMAFMALPSCRHRSEFHQCHVVGRAFERRLDPLADADRLVRDADHIAEQLDALVERDHRDVVRRLEAREVGLVEDAERVHHAAAAGRDPVAVRAATRAAGLRGGKPERAATAAALQPHFAGPRAGPERRVGVVERGQRPLHDGSRP